MEVTGNSCTNLKNAYFSLGSLLIGTSFYFAKANKTKFDRVDCSRADFSNANLEKASFWSTDLSQARFYKASLLLTSFWNSKNLDMATIEKCPRCFNGRD